MKQYVCSICGFIYDEAAGIPSAGIASGTTWEALPNGWVCPLCGAEKSNFKAKQDAPATAPQPIAAANHAPEGEMKELSVGALSALCSNLARGCEKQYLKEESALFTELSTYFKGKTPAEEASEPDALLQLVQQNLETEFVNANAAANAVHDRGALRALVWSEKVTHILNSLLQRYAREGDAFLANTHVYVCETCGFVYVGDVPPAICPICKVPSWKIALVERR
ncbi:MAG: rubredoxin [Ruthenibacterium sp.]